MLVTDTWSLFSEKAPDYPHRIAANLTVDGLPYSGNVDVLLPGSLFYVNGTRTDDGQVVLQALPRKYAAYHLCLLIIKEGRPYSSELVTPDNAVVYDLVISTSGGGGAPTGDPATLTGKVERVLDNQAEPAARQLVAIENKPDGTWSVTGETLSDSETGDYTLNVLTEGGDTFVLALDDYGAPFTPSAEVAQNDLIHPTIPNGHVYRVEIGGTLPDTEPDWWLDTGTNNTRTLGDVTLGDVTLRAIPFYRPLAHGPVKPEPTL